MRFGFEQPHALIDALHHRLSVARIVWRAVFALRVSSTSLSSAAIVKMAGDLASMSLGALRRQLEDLRLDNQSFLNENALLSSYMQRRIKQHEVDEFEALIAQQAAQASSADDGADGRPVDQAQEQLPSELTLDQKVMVGNAEAEAAKKDTKEMLDDAQNTFDMLKALTQQIELRTTELRKEAHEFRRDVVLGAENPRDGTVMAEKLVSYYEDVLRHKDSTIDKMRLKIVGLKQQEDTLKKTLSKEDVGEVLHYIDFHQLQIENNQATSALEEKNTELMRLKLTTAATVGTLNTLKTRLSSLVKQAATLKGEIAARRALCLKLREENAAMGFVIERSRKLHDTLVVQARSAKDMPQPIDYVELVRTQVALSRELAQWARKVEITNMTLTRAATNASRAAASGYLSAEGLPLSSTRHLEGMLGNTTSSSSSAGMASAQRTGHTAAGVTMRAASGLPGSTRPIAFGSTSIAPGSTGTRAYGAVAGLTRRDERVGAKPPVKPSAPPTLAPSIGGFAGSITLHTVATGKLAGVPVGTLQVGRPLTLAEQEKRKAQVIAADILGRKTLPAGPLRLGSKPDRN